jgi:hypothetical protein
LLNGLTPLERATVEWKASGCTSAEAYRRASGRDGPSVRQAGHQILARPRVAAALAAALGDRNVGARLDRQWLFQKLYATIAEAQDMHTPAGMRVLVSALALLARLQGEIGAGRRFGSPVSAPPERPEVRKRIDEMLAEVTGMASTPKAPPPEPHRLDHLVAEAGAQASLPRPRPAVVDPSVVTPPATNLPDNATAAVAPAIPAAERTWSYGSPEPVATPPSPEDGLPIGVLRAGPLNVVRRPAMQEPIPDEPAPPKWLVTRSPSHPGHGTRT